MGDSDEGMFSNCNNFGIVSNNGGAYVGGIAGRNLHGGYYYHCSNYGNVTGFRYVGGISGYVEEGGEFDGCVNYADISGEDLVGRNCGICIRMDISC